MLKIRKQIKWLKSHSKINEQEKNWKVKGKKMRYRPATGIPDEANDFPQNMSTHQENNKGISLNAHLN